MNIQIDNPRKEDKNELENFFLLTITNTFNKNNIDDPEDMHREVEHQMKIFHSPDDYLLLAKVGNQIAGTIAYGKMNKSVSANIPENLHHIKEIKCVYVHPDFQSMGIGSLLWKTLLSKLKDDRIKRACLDSGYASSQGYWTLKIGEPTIFMKDYWRKGNHHMIWFFNIDDIYNRAIT